MEDTKISVFMSVAGWAQALESYPTWLFQTEQANAFAESTYEDPAEFWHSTAARYSTTARGCIRALAISHRRNMSVNHAKLRYEMKSPDSGFRTATVLGA